MAIPRISTGKISLTVRYPALAAAEEFQLVAAQKAAILVIEPQRVVLCHRDVAIVLTEEKEIKVFNDDRVGKTADPLQLIRRSRLAMRSVRLGLFGLLLCRHCRNSSWLSSSQLPD
jgi:hypothetical protein